LVIIDDIRIYVHCKLGNSIKRQSCIKDSIDVSVNAIHVIIPRIVWLNWKCDFIIFEAKKVSDGIRVALFRQCSDDNHDDDDDDDDDNGEDGKWQNNRWYVWFIQLSSTYLLDHWLYVLPWYDLGDYPILIEGFVALNPKILN
jgi:hypothetical protein